MARKLAPHINTADKFTLNVDQQVEVNGVTYITKKRLNNGSSAVVFKVQKLQAEEYFTLRIEFANPERVEKQKQALELHKTFDHVNVQKLLDYEYKK